MVKNIIICIAEISVEPQTQLVLLGDEDEPMKATFFCQGTGLAFHWAFNGKTVGTELKAKSQKMGFTFQQCTVSIEDNLNAYNVFNSVLQIPIRAIHNNTIIQCGVTNNNGIPTFSSEAYLIINDALF